MMAIVAAGVLGLGLTLPRRGQEEEAEPSVRLRQTSTR
jgi:hypothetical protein